MRSSRAVRTGILTSLCIVLFTSASWAGSSDSYTAHGTDSLNVEKIGQWEICNTYTVDCDVSRNLAFVGIGGSVIVLDISDPASPQELGTLSTVGLIRDFSCVGDYLYVADWDFGLRVLSIADPSNPVILSSLQLEGLLWGLDITGETALLACGDRGMKIVDLADPGNPVQIAESSLSGYATSVAVLDTFAVVTVQNAGLRIFSISDPSNPTLIGSIDLVGTVWDVAISQQYAFVSAGGSGLKVVSLQDPQFPELVGSFNTVGYTRGLSFIDDHVYLANGGSGVRVISVEDKANPEEIGYYDTSRYTWDVAAGDTLIFAGDGEGGILVLRETGPVSIGGGDDAGMYVPRAFSLSQNYPNPFNPTTTIRLTVPEDYSASTKLTIYDARGRFVTTLVDRVLSPGVHSITWDGRNSRGDKVHSGTYLVTLDCDREQIVRKMSVMK